MNKTLTKKEAILYTLLFYKGCKRFVLISYDNETIKISSETDSFAAAIMTITALHRENEKRQLRLIQIINGRCHQVCFCE